jgi:phosphatidylinositol-3-phosphatase
VVQKPGRDVKGRQEMRSALVVLGAVGLLAACVPPPPPGPTGTTTTTAGATSTSTSSTTSSSVPSSGAPCTGTGTPPGTWDHVALIIFENKPLPKIIGNTTDAPYLNSLARACSYSNSMESLETVSLANYIALTSGFTGHNGGSEVLITSNASPSVWPQDSVSLFELMDAGSPPTGSAAVEWAESMPSNCFLNGSGDFVENHAPFRYYTRTQATLCPTYSRPFTGNPADQLSARFNLIIPNKVHDMHLVPGTTIAQRIQNGDTWAKTYLPALLASPQYQAGRTAIIITWDEGNGSDFTVPFIVVTPYTKAGGVSSVAYDHYSTLKGIEQMLGVTPLLGHAGDGGKSSVRDDAAFRLG